MEIPDPLRSDTKDLIFRDRRCLRVEWPELDSVSSKQDRGTYVQKERGKSSSFVAREPASLPWTYGITGEFEHTEWKGIVVKGRC